jgi:hypothetical protein
MVNLLLDQTVIYEPSQRHHCAPPRYRPRDEWRSMPAPPGWLKSDDQDRKVRLPLPTEYRPGTVWVCECGAGWVRRAGQHYGRNPNFGHTEGAWSPVPFYAFWIHRRIATYERECAYERNRATVRSFILPAA